MSLAIILILKHSVRFGRNLSCGGVAASPSMACVLCAVQSTAHNTHTNDVQRIIVLDYLLNEAYSKDVCDHFTKAAITERSA